MPFVSIHEQVLLSIGTSKKMHLDAMSQGNNFHPLPVSDLRKQAVSDRLALAGEHQRFGDQLLLTASFRASIGRHYYAMYHSARAITFGEHGGDDFQRHSVLPRNLPAALPDRSTLEVQLTDARLLRNKADYDPYPPHDQDWEADARQLSATASAFVQACETYAIQNGLL